MGSDSWRWWTRDCVFAESKAACSGCVHNASDHSGKYECSDHYDRGKSRRYDSRGCLIVSEFLLRHCTFRHFCYSLSGAKSNSIFGFSLVTSVFVLNAKPHSGLPTVPAAAQSSPQQLQLRRTCRHSKVCRSKPRRRKWLHNPLSIAVL